MSDEMERVLSVFELAQGLKRTVEDATAGFWVEGEVGRLTSPQSGHLYFTLKDETRDAAIDCVMYKREAMRFGRNLSEGARTQLRGKASFYPPRGRLQWIAEAARPAGRGALLEALEKLKKRLVAEGLTDPANKRPLPSDPRVVGVVTSETGAAFYDICTVAARRGPVRLLLSPALVQGDFAPQSLIEALDRLEAARPDVIIFGRGGGSQEDLMAFNDEAVVRRVAQSRIPIVSAVGHEIDTSLCDLVADVRAATPSQAAELVVPDSQERLARLRDGQKHLARGILGRLALRQHALDRARHRLGDPRFILAEGQQDLDELRLRLSRLGSRLAVSRRDQLEQNRRRLYARHPRAVLANAKSELRPLSTRLDAAVRRRVAAAHAALAESGRSLSALSPLSILGRGYALATGPDGVAIRDAEALTIGSAVEVRVCRGSFAARVEKVLSTVENAAAFDHESPAPSFSGQGSGSDL
jgi:exodeoxyribonuclease VII large subunit